MSRFLFGGILALTALGCSETVFVPVEAPSNLIYQLEPSGEPTEPLGVLLRWDGVSLTNLSAYRVYSRPNTSTAFGLRGETTSLSFHDGGRPELEYFVVAVDLDGIESPSSNTVVVDERLRLDAPDWIATTTLSGAIHVAWADNAFTAAPTGFKQYRIYSASYSLDDPVCRSWALEGTTIAPEFLVSSLPNGFPRCFGVSAESIEGWESLWSPLRADTPRPDARNVVVFASDVDLTKAGFRFFQDMNNDRIATSNELGIVTSGGRIDIDFRVVRDANDSLYLESIRAGTGVRTYTNGPIADLTAIDFAPASGYVKLTPPVRPRWGYVFEMDGGDQFARYGGLRLTHVGRDYVIFDWSYQTDPGNPELIPPAGG